MEIKEMVSRTFGQMWATTERAMDGLTAEEIAVRPKPDSNSIGWIVWHMVRLEDMWVHTVLTGRPQLWENGWAVRMGMPPDTRNTGAGMTPEQIEAFSTPDPDLLRSYIAAVREDTAQYFDGLEETEFDREIEAFRGHKMTVGQLFSHLFCEMNQHAGQVAYLRGFIQG